MSRAHLTTAAAVGIALTLALGACSSSSGSAGAAGGRKVVYIPGLTGNPFYNTVSCGAQTEAKKDGVDYQYQGASTFSVAEQTKILNGVVATRPEAVLVSITDPVAMVGPLTQAKNSGIKIIGIDGDLSDTSVMTTNIQADGSKSAQLAGDALGKAAGGHGTVLVIDNATGSVVSKARTDGFAEAIHRDYPGMRILPIQYSDNDVSKAASFVTATAANTPDLVGVFGVETNNTQGALTGVRESGKTGQVKVVGFDTSDPIVAALKDGSLLGTVAQDPRGEGAAGVDSAVTAVQGKSVQRNQGSDAMFLTPQNVDSPQAKQHIYDVNCSG